MIRKIYNKTLLKIFFALLLIACIMFISNYVVFRYSIKEMYTQVSENNKLVVNNIIRSFDQYFTEVNNIIDDINALPSDIYDPAGYKNLNMVNVYMIEKNLMMLVSPYDYVDTVIVYFSSSDLAITSNGTINFNDFFNKKYYNAKYAPEFWRNFAVTKHTLKIIPSVYYSELVSDNNIKNLYKRELLGIVGNNQASRLKMNVLLFINMEKLLKRVNQENMMKGTSLVVLDQEKNIILNTGEDYDLNSLGSIYLDSGNETTVKTEKYEYYCVKSNYNDFIYINKIPYNYKNTFKTIESNRIILIITLFLGIITAAFLSIYLYKPINKILKLIGFKSSEETQNKYKQICSGIEQIKKENEIFKNQISSIEQEIQRSVFFKMIDDIANYKNLKSQIDTYFGAVFSKEFIMVSFILDPTGISVGANNGQFWVLSEDAVIIIREILNARFGHSVVFHIEKKQFIALIDIKHPVKREDILGLIRLVINDLKETILCEYNITTAVSKTYSDVQDCKTAFEDIEKCMAFRNIRLTNNIIDAENIDYNYDIYFPSDFTEKLSNYILSGNSKESINIINQLITENIDNNINYFMFVNVVTNIFNNIVNTLAFYNYDKNEIKKKEQKFFEKINNSENYKDISLFLNTIIEQATERIQLKNQSKLNKDFITQYINLHYMENLYLDNVAKVLDTSPKYFSKYFKRVFGINYIEYLNKVKILHAKEFLKSTNISVGEIGEKIGYANSTTFTSTFKKYCGISPTEYRKENKYLCAPSGLYADKL